MKAADIIQLYQDHAEVIGFAHKISQQKFEKYRLKGWVGSQLSFLTAAMHRHLQKPFLLVMNEKEEALYAHTDLQLLMPDAEVLYYPASYKRPYQIEEIDNANVLQRAEVLNALNHSKTGCPLIITFAEALYEKVVNRRSLLKNTFEIRVGDSMGMEFVVDLLDTYQFDREEFVFEPGQFSMRGGILDIFSYASDTPFRIEFEFDDIKSIRTFDLESQLTDKDVSQISIIPNIQTNFIKEEKISFMEYISAETLVFTKSIDFIATDLDRIYEKAEDYYITTQKNTGGSTLTLTPEYLYENGKRFLSEVSSFSVVELGNTAFFPQHSGVLEWKGNAQPTFNKAFEVMCEHFKQQKSEEIQTYVFSDNGLQFQRLEEIFAAFHENELFVGVEGEIHEGFYDSILGINCYTDHQIFERYHKYKTKTGFKRSQALTLKEIRALKSGDYVTHINHGIGRFAGLHKVQVGEYLQEAIKIIFSGGDEILVNVNALYKVAKYVGKEGDEPKLSKLGSGAWEKAKSKTKARVKSLAFDLVKLYALRRLQKGHAYSPDGYLHFELAASFMYEDTPDQIKANEDVRTDMEKPYPMDRLVCGDVGFGKTEVAVRAAFKAVVDGKQVAILVPTTILALQHYKTFANRLRNLGVTVEYVSRFRTDAEIKETLQRVADGKVDILIGTHRIVSKDVIFKELGLLIIDEEQRFGVNVKDKLKTMKVNVDSLTLTATPIPRTLQFSLTGIRDLSIIATPPPNRQPVETIICKFDAVTIRDALVYELKRGGQVFFIHPRVKDIDEVAASLLKLVPDAKIRIAHGQMGGDKLEEVMTQFIEGEFDILVSTTIVESGLDIANANTIIINEANKYGLSELHQMRGRVGRSNRKAFCYLIAPPDIILTTDARKRLKAMEEFTDLGSGFYIAMRDLDIRGAGDLLGGEQSGFVAEVGQEMYHKILEEAVQELKEEHFADLFADDIKKRKSILVEDVHLDMELDIKIPEHYIPSMSERLNFYRKIAFATQEEEFQAIGRELINRFGPLPTEVFNLFDATRIREAAKRCGLDRIIVKGKTLRMYFIADQNSPFYQGDVPNKVVEYVNLYGGKIQMNTHPKRGTYLEKAPVKGVKEVLEAVQELRDFIIRL